MLQVPLAEVITDYFDQLKSRTKGYASMSFAEIGYRRNDLVRMDIRIHGEDACTETWRTSGASWFATS
jgi:translation elongation factor EF-4